MTQAETGPVVVKVGGSTLGSHDTSMKDIAELSKQGTPVVVVHGGGKAITDWLARAGVATSFVRGLRVTDAQSLEVVVAVLGGLINKQLTAEFASEGAAAIGLSGSDGSLLQVTQADPDLGFVGAIRQVDASVLSLLLGSGRLPVVAPIGIDPASSQLFNVNADTAAGAIAKALGASELIFLTDVAGVLDSDGKLLSDLDRSGVAELISSGVVGGGMIPKVDACLMSETSARIVDGRLPGALAAALAGKNGTRIRGERETVKP